jgi:hypothetical protein
MLLISSKLWAKTRRPRFCTSTKDCIDSIDDASCLELLAEEVDTVGNSLYDLSGQ